MQQSKIESGIEIFFNYLTGFLIAWATYAYIVMPNPWLIAQPFWVTVIFTAISIVRSFLWRRFFNAGLHKVVHKMIGRAFRGKSQKV